ncbi:MAG TPA: hypothetical protein VGZ22_04170 [Isosphaeraceae bacterium]|jgi:hypothetical protein|nr:hypothetical protein [Isosphaeraceae bacterium]
MRPIRELGLVGIMAISVALGANKDSSEPADFKLMVLAFEAGDRPVDKAELVVHRGRVYQFRSSSQEIVIFDPNINRVDLLDLDHKTQSSITLHKLDDAMNSLRRAIGASIAKLEKEGGRSNKLLAQMSRDLLEPKLTASYEPQAHRLLLKGSSIDVVATGELEGDAARLSLIAAVLPALVKLESMRDVRSIPPFTQLETITALVDGHKLRPTEMSFLYRQAGPPQRLRWTYQLVNSLTDREREALARIEHLRLRADSLPLEKYEEKRGQ